MGRLIYLLNVSLDGYVETPDHSLDWTNVDDELHTWFNDQTRELDASLYGRRLYEVMAAYWRDTDVRLRSRVPGVRGPLSLTYRGRAVTRAGE